MKFKKQAMLLTTISSSVMVLGLFSLLVKKTKSTNKLVRN